MYSTRLLLSAILTSVIFGAASAKIWRVDSNLGNWAHFRTLQAANDSSGVVNDDTLYVAGSPATYGNVTFTKRLVIIGPGYFLGENPNTQANPATARADNLTLSSTAAGSVMMGIHVASNITINASNTTIRRNLIAYWVYMGWNNSVTNVIFSQNFVSGGVSVANTSNNITISNNIIAGYISSNSTSSLLIVNNVLNISGYSNPFSVQNSIIENTISYAGSSADTVSNNIYLNNICNGTYLPFGNNNQRSVTMSNVFLLTGSSDGRWQLKGGSPALGTGTNGYDIGSFGGPNAYVLSGIPPIPAIYNLSAPTYGTSTQGLQVQVKAKSRN